MVLLFFLPYTFSPFCIILYSVLNANTGSFLAAFFDGIIPPINVKITLNIISTIAAGIGAPDFTVVEIGKGGYVEALNKTYKEYDFENNVGYGTKKHIEGIKAHGITPIHRLSFLSKKEVYKMKLLIPKMYQESIYTINYDKLKRILV